MKKIIYSLTQLSLKNYFGRKLVTTKISVATAPKSSQDFPILDGGIFKSHLDNEQHIKKNFLPWKLCCLKVLNIKLDICFLNVQTNSAS